MNSRILCHLRGNLFSVPATMSSRWKHFITITLHRRPPLIPAYMTKYLYIQYSGYVYCLLAPRPPLKPNEMNPFRSYYYTFIFHFVSSASASFLLLLLLVYCQVSHPHPHPPILPWEPALLAGIIPVIRWETDPPPRRMNTGNESGWTTYCRIYVWNVYYVRYSNVCHVYVQCGTL